MPASLLMLSDPHAQTSAMLPERLQWIERNGRWEVVDGNHRVVAIVQATESGAHVVLDLRAPHQIIKAHAASVAQGRRYVERWLSAQVKG